MIRSKSYIATPPGATIKEQLLDIGMTQKEFAMRMDMSEKHISKLINGEVQLTHDCAMRLEMVLGVPASFWNNLEAIYREKLVKVQAENSMEHDEEIVRLLPYKEMSDKGWVPETKSIKERVFNLRKFFQVVDLSILKNISSNNIACRRLGITNKSDLALMAWSQQARIVSRTIRTQPINIKHLINNLNNIKEMSLQSPEDFSVKLQSLLSDCGIALVFIPHLKGSFLHGATFYDCNKIVLGLTARGSDADRFWFSLFHELGHIVLGHLGQVNGIFEEDESNADKWAREQLIPSKEYNEFVEHNIITSHSIIDFANSINIAAGIVVGRLQYDKIIKHNMYNELKEHYIMN